MDKGYVVEPYNRDHLWDQLKYSGTSQLRPPVGPFEVQ